MAETPAIRFLKARSVEFQVYLYEYNNKGGARQEVESLHIELHKMLKTIVFKADTLDPFLVIMFGDQEVPEKELAQYHGVKKVFPCDAKTTSNWTGYQFGGTSPFGTRRPKKVFVPREVLNLDEIYINGGQRGLILGIKPNVLLDYLDCEIVHFNMK
ncbi:MAG: YbaK/EbsC family protein [Candidatus Kapaibacteriales bacterium]